MPDLDASTPARVTATSATTVTTASFTPPGGSVLVATYHRDGAATIAPAFSNSGTTLTWVLVHSRNGADTGGENGTTAMAYAVVPTGGIGSTTVTGSMSSLAANQMAMRVYVWTGVDTADPLGAILEGSVASAATLTTGAFTSEQSNSVGVFCCNATPATTQTGTPTSSNSTFDGFNVSQEMTGGSGYRATASAGEAMSFTVAQAGGVSAAWNWVSAEFRSSSPDLPAPAGLTVTAVSESRLDLDWDAVNSATGYDIERGGVVIVTDHPTTSYSDTGLAPSTTYSYRVRARQAN